MQKQITLVFYQEIAAPALALAASLRTGENIVVVRRAVRHPGDEREVCNKVLVMPDVDTECMKEMYRLYPKILEKVPSPKQPTEEPPRRTAGRKARDHAGIS